MLGEALLSVVLFKANGSSALGGRFGCVGIS
jgi:hypothetical protein